MADPGPFFVRPFQWVDSGGVANGTWPMPIPAMSVDEARVVASAMYSLCTGWAHADSMSKHPPFAPPGASWRRSILHAHAIGRITYRVRNVFMGLVSPGAFALGSVPREATDRAPSGRIFLPEEFAMQVILRLHRARAISAWGKHLRVSKNGLDEWLAAQCLAAEVDA